VKSIREIDEAITSDVWASTESYDNLITLCSWYRFGGTPGEVKARDFLLQKFKDYGLDDSHTEEFTYNGWINGTAKLEVTEPVELELFCKGMPNSPSTTSKGVEGELIFIDPGAPEDFDALKNEIPGKIVMATSTRREPVNRRYLRADRELKLSLSIINGAKAFIFMTGLPGELIQQGSCLTNGLPCEIPAVSVSYETGQKILHLQRKGPVRVRITAKHTLKRLPSWNVVGDITGTEMPEEIILIGAMFDGHEPEGAQNGAGGPAVTLEMARVLEKHKGGFKRTIRFVELSTEEMGVVGCYNYVRMHESELKNIKFMLALDAAGTNPGEGIDLQNCPELTSYMREIAKEIVKDVKYEFPVRNYLMDGGDSFPFVLKGVPSGSKHGEWRHFEVYHTSADTTDKLDPRDIQRSAIVFSKIVARMANADEIPARHRTPEEVKQLLIENGFEWYYNHAKQITLDELVSKGLPPSKRWKPS